VTRLSERRRDVVVCFILVAITLAAFWQVHTCEFVQYDDGRYVYENEHVKTGLTPANILWAFTSGYASNWHPLTWLSHQLDCQIYGLEPRGHHITNLVLHIANAVLLFMALRHMTRSVWRSAFVAAAFAVHPLHVESVAWVAERKDVLSSLFWMLTMIAYWQYVRNPSVRRYALVVLLLALGLMAKPMLVTLPFVLLLVDYWPLGRTGEKITAAGCWKLLREKIPLFVLAAASSVVTFVVQLKGGAMSELEGLTLSARVANGVVAYISYIGKTVWPANLAVLYPFPLDGIAVWQVASAALVLTSVTAFVWRLRRRRPYLLVGWAWYLGTLVPVIGIVKIGYHAMADRYTYVPLVGLFVMLAWGIPDMLETWLSAKRRRLRAAGLAVASTLLLITLMICTWSQVRYWRDTRTLYERAVSATSDNAFMHRNLGNLLDRQDKLDEAKAHYIAAIRIDPDYAPAHYGLGRLLTLQGQLDEAIYHLEEAVRIKPDYLSALTTLGIALFRQGRTDEGIDRLSEAIAFQPDTLVIRYNLGTALLSVGRTDEAIEQFCEMLSIDPARADAHYQLGAAYLQKGDDERAATHFSEAARVDPNYSSAIADLGTKLAQQGRFGEAAAIYKQALRVAPDATELRYKLAAALEALGRSDEAAEQYSLAIHGYSNQVDAWNSVDGLSVDRGSPRPADYGEDSGDK